MEIYKLRVLSGQETISIDQNNDHLQLLGDIRSLILQDELLITHYQTANPLSFVIQPASLIPQKNRLIILYHAYGQALSSLPQYDYADLWKENLLEQLINIYVHFSKINPIINIDNLYYLRSQPIKVLVKVRCSPEEYIDNFKRIIAVLFKGQQDITSRAKAITSLEQINLWQESFQPPKEGKSITRLIQLKAIAPKIVGKKIELTEEEWKWIFSSADYPAIPKYESIYNGIQHKFDPLPLLKAASKQTVFYLIQNTKQQKVAFFPSIKPQLNPNSLFGTYYPDKSKKSVLLGIKKRSIHKLIDESNAVGYGPEMLLVIGKLDIMLSAFNCTNLSYFPISYAPDAEANSSKDLLGQKFTLKQFEAYRIVNDK